MLDATSYPSIRNKDFSVANRCSTAFIRLLTMLVLLGGVSASVAQGQVSFSTPPTYNLGTGANFVGDFNGDGKPDILAGAILNLGNGGGTFTTGTPLPGIPVAVADFNGDGNLDVLELATGSVQVLIGNGDGTFQTPVTTNIGATLTVTATADLNGDGNADVVGISNNTLLVYLSNGDGTFETGVPYSMGANQISATTLIEFGDFNGDHKTDVALLTPGTPGQEIVLLGNGDGTFQSTLHTSTGVTGPVALGDFNGDGKLDIATLQLNTTFPPLPSTVFLLLGNGDGTFQGPTAAFNFQLTGSESPTVAAADLNNDGKLDLVVAADAIGIYLGNGNGTFSTSPNNYVPLGSAQIEIADFNLDGKLDIACGEILLGNGDGSFQGLSAALPGLRCGCRRCICQKWRSGRRSDS